MSQRLLELQSTLADVKCRWTQRAVFRAWTLGAVTAATEYGVEAGAAADHERAGEPWQRLLLLAAQLRLALELAFGLVAHAFHGLLLSRCVDNGHAPSAATGNRWARLDAWSGSSTGWGGRSGTSASR